MVIDLGPMFFSVKRSYNDPPAKRQRILQILVTLKSDDGGRGMDLLTPSQNKVRIVRNNSSSGFLSKVTISFAIVTVARKLNIEGNRKVLQTREICKGDERFVKDMSHQAKQLSAT